MGMKSEGNTITCDCGFSFQRGHSGKHECADGLRAKLAAALRREESLKASTDVLARRIAELEPIGCIKTICGNKTLQWWRDAPEGAEVFTAPPEPAYPEKLPCAVHLLPGLKLGEGGATTTLLEALTRREEYNADIAAMTVEKLADQEDAFNVIKAMLPAPVVPDGWKLVPAEPTPKQWAAGIKAMDGGIDKVTLAYKAMVDVAPTPTQAINDE